MTEEIVTDWECVEREFRAGKLSIREIARGCGVSDTAIRKKAKREGWMRDLSAKIDEEVRNKLVRAEVRKEKNLATEREIIEAAAGRSIEILTIQRADIEALRVHEERLLEMLANNPTKLFIAQYQGGIVESVVGLTVTEQAATLSTLASVRERRINLERQAYNINDKRDVAKTDLHTILEEIGNMPKRLPCDD